MKLYADEEPAQGIGMIIKSHKITNSYMKSKLNEAGF